jgi:hypothetical protein
VVPCVIVFACRLIFISQAGGIPTLEADIWALGAVMAEIAADGRPPFHALSDAAVAELLRDAQRDRAAIRDLLQLPDDTPGAISNASTLQRSVDRLVCAIPIFHIHLFIAFASSSSSRFGRCHSRLPQLESARATDCAALRSAAGGGRRRGFCELLLLRQTG